MSPALALDRRCLVLNADFSPIATWPLSLISAKDAVRAALSDEVTILDEWPEVFRSPSISVQVPKVVALREYAPVHATPKFCRASILLRDRYCCQYCGERFPSEDLTYDHVIPRSKNGRTEWSNILMACVPCNQRKRNTMPNFSGRRGRDDGGMRPLKAPRQPTTAELLRAGLELLDDRTRETYGAFLYWNSPLEP